MGLRVKWSVDTPGVEERSCASATLRANHTEPGPVPCTRCAHQHVRCRPCCSCITGGGAAGQPGRAAAAAGARPGRPGLSQGPVPGARGGGTADGGGAGGGALGAERGVGQVRRLPRLTPLPQLEPACWTCKLEASTCRLAQPEEAKLVSPNARAGSQHALPVPLPAWCVRRAPPS